jgi:hypothetical protein
VPIELDMMLADSATISDGGLNIVGAGWIVRPPSVVAGPSAIAIVARIPRDELRPHQIRIELLDRDDQIVVVNPPDGPGPMVFDVDLRMAPGGTASGNFTVPVTVAAAFNLPPFPLPKASEFRWRVFLDGETREPWVLPFRTSPPKAPTQPRPRP